jgi:hypothetical protein
MHSSGQPFEYFISSVTLKPIALMARNLCTCGYGEIIARNLVTNKIQL